MCNLSESWFFLLIRTTISASISSLSISLVSLAKALLNSLIFSWIRSHSWKICSLALQASSCCLKRCSMALRSSSCCLNMCSAALQASSCYLKKCSAAFLSSSFTKCSFWFCIKLSSALTTPLPYDLFEAPIVLPQSHFPCRAYALILSWLLRKVFQCFP